MIYFDTTYLVRLYVTDPGWTEIRELARTNRIACSILGHAEVIGAFHRKFREGTIKANDLATLIDEFERDSAAGAVNWLPLSDRIIARLVSAFKMMPAATALRSSDAVHLATAAENNFTTVYTNDRQLLAASSSFNIQGKNII